MITKDQQKALLKKAHALNPVVLIGQKGLTEPVHAEIEIALEHHELIKLKLSGDKETRQGMRDAILAHHNADLVQEIGGTIVVYRVKKK